MMTGYPTIDEIRAKASAFAYGEALIENSYRGLVAELIIAEALGAEWQMCSKDWNAYDFKHSKTGCLLEVKQSAARQTWTKLSPPKKPSKARFSLKRNGEIAIYVFAYHPIQDESANHWDASQWQFYVIATNRLPDKEEIELAEIAALADVVPWGGLRAVVEDMRGTLGL